MTTIKLEVGSKVVFAEFPKDGVWEVSAELASAPHLVTLIGSDGVLVHDVYICDLKVVSHDEP
jgi:hypothetical protein